MNYKSIADLNADIVAGIHTLPTNIDLIIGLPRGGVLAASILAAHTHLPLIDVDGFAQGRPAWFGRTKSVQTKSREGARRNSQDAHHPLLFDDSVYSGRSMQKSLEQVRSAAGGAVTTGVVYAKPELVDSVDIYFQRLHMPRLFEWNLMHHSALTECCVGMEGVLCREPTIHESGSDEHYREFIRSVPPLLTPSVEIGWIVTNRSQKYRAETEAWLARHGIRYKALRMRDAEPTVNKKGSGTHAAFKADVYKTSGAKIFIARAARDAAEIAKLADKRVLCYENGQIIWPDGFRSSWARYKQEHGFHPGAWRKNLPRYLSGFYKKFRPFRSESRSNLRG